MTQIRSHAFREWESDVNDIHSLFEGNREIAFKKFIQSIKTKTVCNFKPIGPFMERKRQQESSPEYQNQNQNQDKRPKVASKKFTCSMCVSHDTVFTRGSSSRPSPTSRAKISPHNFFLPREVNSRAGEAPGG